MANTDLNKTDVYGVTVSGLKAKYKGEEISYPDFTIKNKVLLVGDSVLVNLLYSDLLGKLKPEAGQVAFFDKNGQAFL